VRREDDRVTIWIREHIREPYADHPNLWFMLCLARFINWPPTLQRLMDEGAWPVGDEYDPTLVAHVLDALAATNEKVWTGAYLIKGDSDMRRPAVERRKAFYVAHTVMGGLWDIREIVLRGLPYGLWQTWYALSGRYGVGPFLAYQAVVDMTFCPRLLADAPDRGRWAAAGPGTLRGLRRLFNELIDGPALSQSDALHRLRGLYDELRGAGIELDFSDTANVCCEMDKYLRAKNGEGRPKARYVSHEGLY
jgi:hypothetical protein